jgi:hypothetical protein
MGVGNGYWLGTDKATLYPNSVQADWGSGEHSGSSIRFCNKAFDIFYQARQAWLNIQWRVHAEKVKEVLEVCGTTGWGIGVHDMRDAFDHYANSGGYWVDEDVANYYGGSEKVFDKFVTAPVSIVNFMTAVDEKGAKHLATATEDYKDGVRRLAQLDLNERSLSKSKVEKDFERSVKIISELKKRAEQVKPWLWTAPAWESHTGKLISVTNVIDKFDQGILTYTAFRMTGFESVESAAFAAMREAVGYVPVLGKFYQKAIDMIPGLASNFESTVKTYHSTIERAMSAR